jgi:hypothetical protein
MAVKYPEASHWQKGFTGITLKPANDERFET